MRIPPAQRSAQEGQAAPAAALAARLKGEALALGFTGVAIVPAVPPASHHFYERWLAAGYAGAMGYLHRHAPLKADPRGLLPGARSLVVVTLNYNPPAPAPPAGGRPRGRVARYAWGRDYHGVLRQKLERLARRLEGWLREEQGRPLGWRVLVDTGPLMEREFAARGGLGWVGKNANLIHWQHGSWLFIGGLLVDAALEPDAPLPPRVPEPAALLPLRESCGTCRACIEACPTGAIVADKTVDARRCISYLTIELQGPIPLPLRPAMGAWVFGCDVCQEVCPWNRTAPRAAEPALEGNADTALPDLAGLLALDQAAFRARFRDTPLARPRRRGLLRNAAIALGNWLAAARPDDPHLPRVQAALRRALDDPEPLVREAAAWALEQQRPPGPAGAAVRDARRAEAPYSRSPRCR
jgi:epoxyqueuosine reductase